MNKKERIKKLLATVLTLAVMLSLFGGIIPGKGSKAVSKSDFGKIYLKTCAFDATGYDYNEVQQGQLYKGSPVSILIKRKTGCRIPKGSYVIAFSKGDYEGLIEERRFPPSEKSFIRYKSGVTRLNYNELKVVWNNGWKAGKYVVCLVCPYTSNQKKYYLYYSWNVRVVNHG